MVRLATAGFRVFASVRRSQDADAIWTFTNDITPVELDVTDARSIVTAAKHVRDELWGRGLDGLVNNAGTGLFTPMEHVALDDVRRQFEVDVFGQLAVTQAFLPLIRQARGRIVNMGSVGARLTMPFGGVVCAAKSAFGAMTDALRLELHPFGIHVCLIEPAAIRTPAVDKTLGDVDRTIAELPPEGAARYAQMLREFDRRAYESEQQGSPPDDVARVVHRALTARRPRARYLVGEHSRFLSTLPRLLPDRLLDQVRYRLFGLPRSFGALIDADAESRA